MQINSGQVTEQGIMGIIAFDHGHCLPLNL